MCSSKKQYLITDTHALSGNKNNLSKFKSFYDR